MQNQENAIHNQENEKEKLSNEEVLMNAKNKDGNFFTVKKVIDEE